MSKYTTSLTWILGIVLTVVGVAGFFVQGGMLLFFEVDTTHNVVHLLSGVVALLAVKKSEAYATLYLKVFGAVYALVTVVGFAMGGDILGLFHVNVADNYLHAAIAIASLAVGFSGKKAGGMMGTAS
jgi:hypothetical protein